MKWVREEYKVHEQKYAVPGWWHPGDGVSGPREPILGFIVTPEEVAGIRAMVADHDTIQTELTRLRGLIQSLGTDARCTYRVTGSEDEWDVVRYVGEYGYGAVATFSSKESADAYAALLREAQR